MTALLALAGAATLGGACTHAHLSDNYGRSYAAWFNAQHIATPTGTSEPARRALSSLDSQEAAAISKNYRKTVGGQEGGAGAGADGHDRAVAGGPHGGLHPAAVGSRRSVTRGPAKRRVM